MRVPTRLLLAAVVGVGVGATRAEPRQPNDTPKAVTDSEFVTKAASGGQFEVMSSKLAVEKAKAADVKAFADKMIDDHTKLGTDLKAAAEKAGIAVPATLGAHHEKMLQQLKTAPGFDAAYMDAQLKAHAEAVGLFTAASKSVKDAGLRSFAEKTLPILKMHYEHAKKHAARTGAGG